MVIKDQFYLGSTFSRLIGEFYVYLYADPDSKIPFYVGKGKGKRILSHLKESNLLRDANTHKANKIRKIIKMGKKPLIYIFKKNLQENTAYRLEDTLITLIGTVGSKTGPLTNIGLGIRGSDTISKNPNKIDICKRISDTLKNKECSKGSNNPMFGKKGEDHPAFGLKHSKESIKKRSSKLSIFLKKTERRKGAKNSMFGRNHTNESKNKISLKAIARGQNNKSNPNAKNIF